MDGSKELDNRDCVSTQATNENRFTLHKNNKWQFTALHILQNPFVI